MTTRLNPYLTFDGNAREAMEFYKEVFGGELSINTFAEYGEAPNPEGVMHVMLESGGMALMASDLPPGMPHNRGDNIAISVSGEDAVELRGYWEKLSGAGNITMPLEKQMWGDEFGMCQDRFGIAWMVNISQPQT